MAIVQPRRRYQASQPLWLRKLWWSFTPFTQWMCMFFGFVMLLIGLLFVIAYGGAHLRSEKPVSRVVAGSHR